MKSVFAILFLSFFLFFLPNLSAQNINLANASKKDESFNLMLRAFLDSNDLESAYRLVKKIVKKYEPNNIYYREWLAKLSLWTDRGNEALENYYYIFKKSGKKELKKQILDLSLSLKRYDIAEEILKSMIQKGDLSKIKDLTYVFKMNAHSKDGIAFFKKIYKKTGSQEVLFEILHLFESEGDVEGMLKTAELLYKKQRFFPTGTALKVARTLYSKRKIKEAYRVLLQAKPYTKDDNYLFWKTLLQLSLVLQEFESAYEALKKIEKSKKADIDDITKLIVFYEKKGKNKEAMKLAYKNWIKYKNPTLFFHFVRIASNLKKWNKIISACQDIKNERLLENPYFWIVLSKAYQEIQDIENAKETYKRGLKYTDFSNDLFTSFIWFLIDTKEIKELKHYISKFERIAKNGHTNALLSAYIALKKHLKAMEIIKKELSKEPDNISLLILYSDILQMYGKFDEAKFVRFKAYKLSLAAMKRDRNILGNREFFENHLRLAFFFEPAYKISKLIKLGENRFGKEAVLPYIISLHLSRNSYESAQFIIERYGVKKW
ncbi:tetratricopeptide repeat protein [Nitrosophilus alvini]|uniref:tetratricopeptide repeat protein n=1 Tax=Nitrosophilus alvini TaxID=2714855 RepID=UPI001F46E7A0|nr:tetratricopeptide repeat protein [Nitrosophilus alvini]